MPTESVKIAPSILAADFARLGQEVALAEQAGADRIHVDVMDGHFVPNISIGLPVVSCLRRATRLPIETHLMIDQPERYLDDFAAAGSDSLLVHVEGALHLHRTLEHVRALGKRVGLVLNPATPVVCIEEVLSMVDLVLVMTVNPGFGGQKFIESMLPKIRRLRHLIDRNCPKCELEVDGGIDANTAAQAVSAGANVLVAGSAIFRAADGIVSAMARLHAAVERRG